MIYDVAIIGGGIAGLSLALDLKQKGHNIIVIEKGSYPRHKVCGEYISMESHNYLHSLCPSLSEYELPKINSFMLTTPDDMQFNTTLPQGGFGISRYLLENLLYREAQKKGIIVMINSRARNINRNKNPFEIITDRETISSQLVCDSTGRKSNLSDSHVKNITTTNYVAVKYHLKLERDPALIEIHNFKGGYCGVSSIENNTACLCYIVNAKYLNDSANSLSRLEQDFLFKNHSLRLNFEKAEFIFKAPLTISGINFLIKQPVRDNVIHLGDSAGNIAPITGNGMSISLRSASILSRQIDDCLKNKINTNQLYHNYYKEWNKNFSVRIKLSSYFQKLAEYPMLTRLSINMFNMFPPLAQSLIKLTHGKPF